MGLGFKLAGTGSAGHTPVPTLGPPSTEKTYDGRQETLLGREQLSGFVSPEAPASINPAMPVWLDGYPPPGSSTDKGPVELRVHLTDADTPDQTTEHMLKTRSGRTVKRPDRYAEGRI